MESDYAKAPQLKVFGSSGLVSFPHVTREQVSPLLSQLKSGSALDFLPLVVMSELTPVLTDGLVEICNISLNTAMVPSKWKMAWIKPLLKKALANPLDLQNYLLISLLPGCSKIMETLVNRHLSKYLEENNLLDTSKSGFRAFHSTEAALLGVTDALRMYQD